MEMRDDGPPQGGADNRSTLIAVGVVVAVMGLIFLGLAPKADSGVGGAAGAAGAVISTARSDAQRKSCYANQRTIEGAVEQYLAADPAHAREDVTGPIDSGSVLLAENYLKEPPACPLGSRS